MQAQGIEAGIEIPAQESAGIGLPAGTDAQGVLQKGQGTGLG
jgi:hypothetical protein